MSRKILITGATGNIAGLVIPQLLEEGVSVRAFVHNASKAGHLKDQGVEIYEGNYSNQEALNKAADGVDSILSITPADPEAFEQASAITSAAVHTNTKLLVRISAIGASKDAPTVNGRLHHETDMEIIDSEIPYTILRPNFFMQNLLNAVPTIKEQGNMYYGMADGKLGFIDVRDIADCAATLLIKGGHEGKIYNPTGPESIDFYAVAKIISDGIGKRVNYVPVEAEAVREGIKAMGMGDWLAKMMMDYSIAYSEGWGDFITDDVKTITGKEPRSFKQFFDEVMSGTFNYHQ